MPRTRLGFICLSALGERPASLAKSDVGLRRQFGLSQA
jgi:hypothetical protein